MSDLKESRQSLGLTQSQMALLMGMHQGHYSDIERGANGREPTRVHWACVRLIHYCHDAGILDPLLSKATTQ